MSNLITDDVLLAGIYDDPIEPIQPELEPDPASPPKPDPGPEADLPPENEYQDPSPVIDSEEQQKEDEIEQQEFNPYVELEQLYATEPQEVYVSYDTNTALTGISDAMSLLQETNDCHAETHSLDVMWFI